MNVLMALLSGLFGNIPDLISDLRKPNNSKKVRKMLDANSDKKVNIDDLIIYSKKLEEVKMESIAKLFGVCLMVLFLINFNQILEIIKLWINS